MFSGRFGGLTCPLTRNALGKSRGVFHASSSGAMLRCVPKAFPSGGCRPAPRHLATPGGDTGDTGDASFPLPAGGRKNNAAGGPAAAAGWQQHPAGALPQGAGSGMCGGGFPEAKGGVLAGGGGLFVGSSLPRSFVLLPGSSRSGGRREKGGVKGQHPCPRAPPVEANARSRLSSRGVFFSWGGFIHGTVIPISLGWA